MRNMTLRDDHPQRQMFFSGAAMNAAIAKPHPQVSEKQRTAARLAMLRCGNPA
jgi:hypothetical protein